MQRIKKLAIVGLAILVLALGATTAQAATVSLSLAETDTWILLSCNTGNCTQSINESTSLTNATKFTTTFDGLIDFDAVARVGEDPDGALTSSDTFEMVFSNVNATTWSFRIGATATDGGGVETDAVSATIDLAKGFSALFSIDLFSLTGDGVITSAWIEVLCTLPCQGVSNEFSAEYEVSPVPIPPALAMFGSALIGLVAMGFTRVRRRRTT